MGVYYLDGEFKISSRSSICIDAKTLNKINDKKVCIGIKYERGLKPYANKLENLLKDSGYYVNYVEEF